MAVPTKLDVINKLRKLVYEVVNLRFHNEESSVFKKWRRDTDVAIRHIFGKHSDHLAEFRSIDFSLSHWDGGTPMYEFDRAYKNGLDNAVALLESMIVEVQDFWEAEGILRTSEKQENISHPKGGQSVFIGHGQNPLWAHLKLYLEKELGLKTVNYESESRVGDSIISVLEQMLTQSSFAVLLLTAEDETSSGKKRARQNVVHEAGLFQGKLGFRKAILLIQEEVEEFTNVSGLQHIRFSGNQIDQTFDKLRRALKREGIIE